jgi:hypothetical protein
MSGRVVAAIKLELSMTESMAVIAIGAVTGIEGVDSGIAPDDNAATAAGGPPFAFPFCQADSSPQFAKCRRSVGGHRE